LVWGARFAAAICLDSFGVSAHVRIFPAWSDELFVGSRALSGIPVAIAPGVVNRPVPAQASDIRLGELPMNLAANGSASPCRSGAMRISRGAGAEGRLTTQCLPEMPATDPREQGPLDGCLRTKHDARGYASAMCETIRGSGECPVFAFPAWDVRRGVFTPVGRRPTEPGTLPDSNGRGCAGFGGAHCDLHLVRRRTAYHRAGSNKRNPAFGEQNTRVTNGEPLCVVPFGPRCAKVRS